MQPRNSCGKFFCEEHITLQKVTVNDETQYYHRLCQDCQAKNKKQKNKCICWTVFIVVDVVVIILLIILGVVLAGQGGAKEASAPSNNVVIETPTEVPTVVEP